MSNSAIDQLFQITTPTRNPLSPVRSGATADGDLFRSLLQRATDVNEVEQPQPAESEPVQLEAEDSIDTGTDQADTTTPSEQDETISTDETTETAETSEDAQPNTEEDNEPSDEVTLSEAAVTVATTVEETPPEVTAAQPETASVIVETSTAQDQQQTNDQQTTNVVETTEEANAELAAFSTTTDFEVESLIVETVSETTSVNLANANGNHSRDGEAPVSEQSLVTANNLSPETSTGDEVEVVTQASLADEQSRETQRSEGDAENNSSRGDNLNRSAPREENQLNLQNPTSTPQDLANALETELAATHNAAPETATATNTSTTSQANEAATLDGRNANNQQANRPSEVTREQSPDTPTVNRTRFVRRVGNAIRTAQQRDGQIQLRLSPPELGTLRIQLTVQEGAVTAQLETETAAARALLLESLPALRERLAELDITIEKFDVDVGRDDQQPTENSSAEDRDSENNGTHQEESAPEIISRESAASDITESVTTTKTISNGLDIRI